VSAPLPGPPYHCPFCADDDLRPHGTTPGVWHCRCCLRVFAVRLLGLERLVPTPSPDRTSTGAAR